MSVVGIDLGTTNTVVGCVRTGKVHVLADEKGVRLLPSVVSFHPNGEVLVGGMAKQRRVIDAKNTVYSHKRLIGRSWGSPEIAQAKSRFAFELREGPGQGPLVHARGQDYTLPEISAFVLKRARQIAETALGTPVERAVITVPAHFNELQRASTKVAGRVSGLEVLRILNEPTAAALAYGLGRTGNERVAVYDFGGGTFDCTLLDLNGNVFEVLATAGDSFLGGDDVDQLIADRMAETYLKQHRQDARQVPEMYERLKTTAEDIKIALSTAETHTVTLKELGHGAGGSAINFTFTMTRKDLDAVILPLVDRTFKVTQDALTLARLSPSSFDKVILVGGSTRMPLVRKRVEGFFGGPPMDRVNPDEVVAIGAAIQAAALTEGIRRRSIPAPPGVPGRPSQNDTQDNTQTTELDPSMLKPAFGSEPPEFGFKSTIGSQPPGGPKFAFASTVVTPPGQQGPPQMPPPKAQMQTQLSATQAPQTQPHPGVPGARQHPSNPQQQAQAQTAIPGRKITNPGVAPHTQPMPMGARQPPPKAPATQATEDDPSMASFPDLSAPTPFEWFPSSGQPSSASGGPTQVRGATGKQPATSERTFGGGAAAAPPPPGTAAEAPEPQTLTQTAAVPGMPGSPPMMPAAGGRPGIQTQQGPGFGAIDEPPSLFSTPSASVPSFPSMSASQQAAKQGMPSPIGEEPWQPQQQQQQGSAPDEHLPDGPFGALPDLSLVSTSGVSSSGVSNPDGGFGHVSDLSLISAQTATAAMEAISNARSSALDSGQFDDETEAVVRGAKGSTVNLDPEGNPAARSPEDDHNSMIDRTDLPAVVNRAKPARKPGAQLGMNPTGGTSMAGKPPPLMAPQPFGPMEKVDEGPLSRTAALQSPHQQPPPQQRPVTAKKLPAAAPVPQTSPVVQARQQQPLATTAPLNQKQPPPIQKRAVPSTEAFGSVQQQHQAPPLPPPQPQTAFGPPAAPPPQQQQQMRQPPPPVPQQQQQPPPYQQQSSPPPHHQQQQGYASPSAPPMQNHFSAPPMHQPPPPQQNPNQPFSFGSAPPGAFGSAPPPMQQQQQPHGGSQPPIFGSFASSPPAQADPSQPLDYSSGGAFDPNTASIPPAPAPPQGIQYQTPVLVDVTPRGLVVETAGGYTDTIIPRNSKIPCERTRRFATGRDMQTTVRVRVGQGESPTFPQNTYLGEVELSGLRPAPRGEVTVAVTFEVDADGTLRVRARDVQTGQEARATLQLVGVADESSVVMMINRFANQPVVGGPTHQ